MSERRINPRIRCKLKIGVIDRDGSVSHCWSYDISKNGLQILYPERFEQGDKLQISMNLLDRSTGRYQRVAVLARVLHSVYDTRHHHFRTGLAFDTFVGDGQKVVESEVDRRIENHLLAVNK